MDFEEARERALICNGRIRPVNKHNQWICDNCGVVLKEEKNNRCGFKHHSDPPEKKTCIKCDEKKLTLEEFYIKKGSLDGFSNICKSCTKNATNEKAKQREAKGRSRGIWLPFDLWNAAEKVKGRQTFRDFIVIAVRKEVEHRAKLIYRNGVMSQVKDR